MKWLKTSGILLFLLILSVIGILTFTKPGLTFISAEYNPRYESVYPPDCFVKFENKKYLITQVCKYRYHFLREYQFTGSEGFATVKFAPFYGNSYSNDQKMILCYSRSGSQINYNSRQYRVTGLKKDTIISKTGPDTMVMFIQSTTK